MTCILSPYVQLPTMGCYHPAHRDQRARRLLWEHVRGFYVRPTAIQLVSESGPMAGGAEDWRDGLLAHGYSVEEHEYVFTFLVEGEPPFEVDAVRFPRSVVASVEGG